MAAVESWHALPGLCFRRITTACRLWLRGFSRRGVPWRRRSVRFTVGAVRTLRRLVLFRAELFRAVQEFHSQSMYFPSYLIFRPRGFLDSQNLCCPPDI